MQSRPYYSVGLHQISICYIIAVCVCVWGGGVRATKKNPLNTPLERGGRGGGASAPGPGARASCGGPGQAGFFFFFFDRKSVGDPGF